MRTTTKLTIAAATLAVFAGTTDLPALQQEVAMVTAVRGERTPPSDRAQQLRAQAEELFSQPTKWRRAARLMEQSARLRDAADPEAYTCLVFAGRIRAALHDYAGARSALEKAAEHAVARGAVLDAAHAFIDAAHIARQEKDVEGARELVERATLLATSPQLSDDEADQIHRRLNA